MASCTSLIGIVSIVTAIAAIAMGVGRCATEFFAMAAAVAGGPSLLVAPAIRSEYTVAHTSANLGGSAGFGENGAFSGFGGVGQRAGGRGRFALRGVGPVSGTAVSAETGRAGSAAGLEARATPTVR